MALVTIDHEFYVPVFDPETNQYHDENPFQKHSRKNRSYECRCKVGTLLTTHSQFSAHRQTKTHRKFIESYETYYKDADRAKAEIKGLLVDNERLKRKVHKCEGIIQIREAEIAFLNGIENVEVDELRARVVSLQAQVVSLKGELRPVDVFEDALQEPDPS